MDPQRLKIASAAALFPKLADLGIHGKSHVMVLEKNNKQIAAVIARWLDKALPPSKKDNRISVR